MEIYLLKFSACLLVFWLVYVFLLERHKMHHFKRFYLLGALALSLLIPKLTLTTYVEPIVPKIESSRNFIPFETTAVIEIPIEQSPVINLEITLWLIYGLGVFLFLLRFAVNSRRLYRLISKNETIAQRSFIYVLLKEYRIPHSFFKYIFLNELNFYNNTIPSEVVLHEETHAKQLHSIDVIVIELLQIVLWFHPLIYILKHHIKLNHEFLADQAVLRHGADTSNYQKILLQFSSNTRNHQLVSAINYSSIKKRFTVMKTNTSTTRIWASSLLLLPIIAILYYSFAQEEYVEKENSKISEAITNQLDKVNEPQVIYEDGATETMIKEYKDWIKQLNNDSSSLLIPVGTFERLTAIYDLMSKEQRNSVETHPFLQEITPELYSVEPTIPSATQFESWKNEKVYAIWLDRKHISNSELNNYQISEIAHYTGSKIQKNARNQNFPQPFQFNLYTKDGFNKYYTEAFVSGYNEICQKYSIAIHDYLKGPQTDNSELRILKAQADKFYNQFTKEELKKHDILPVPPVPAVQKIPKTILNILIKDNGKLIINNETGDLDTLETFLQNLEIPKDYTISFKAEDQVSQTDTEKVLQLLKKYKILFSSNQIELSTQQKKATGKQVAAYNTWARSINRQMLNAKASNDVNAYPIVKVKEVNKYKAIYDIMTVSQKKDSEIWPSFPPPPPPPSLKSPEIREIKDVPPPPPLPEKATLEQKKKYNHAMDNYNTKKHAKVTTAKNKNGEVIEIIEIPDVVDIPPPPPPKNPSFLEYIKEMEEKGAIFLMDGKKITAKEAKTIARKNKGKGTDMITQKDAKGKYVVKLSKHTEE
ncbi:Signal transducer regulating beta-lactamase production, contains metallopeptidase domain [Formosa sp. Hel1_31_208]|uniref:M56 family metallopeptidase n=1 Tax=Formosa sp. Hel1_31_208 TaxID=1798225 RepID=UPI00087B4408|nr:M56 family metallopeptidase [Formosa sp. Hel1_31_208]SDR86384.1 Signal transducer regulating beta-lactamase production, contains metallopeptidase domain [Formosa sp. Hel1_31_208]